MPSKKKSKPSYSVPEDIQPAAGTGWVYRSESADSASDPPPKATRASVPHAEAGKPAKTVEAAAPETSKVVKASTPAIKKEEKKAKKNDSITSDLVDLASKTVTSGMAAVGNALLLGARLATAPLVVGIRMMGFGSK